MTAGRPAGGGPADKGVLGRNLRAAIGHHRAGRLDDAERLYNDILAQHPEQPDALNFLGVLASQRGVATAAIDYLTRAIAVNRRHPAYHYNLGLAYQAANRAEDSSDSFRRVLELKSDHVDALKGLGGALLTLNRLEEAERCCRKAIKMAPQDPRAHNNLCAVLLGRELIDEAEASAHEALRLMPNFAEAHNNLGNIFLARESYDEAARCYRKALRLAPQYADPHHNLGVALRGLGDVANAIESFRKAIKFRKNYAEAYNSLANTYRSLGYLPDAEYLYKEALRYKADYAIAQSGLAAVSLERGELEPSLALYEEMLRQDPTSQLALAGKAEVSYRKGEKRLAYEMMAPLIDQGNPAPAVAGVFSRVASRYGRRDEAIELLRGLLKDADLTADERRPLHFRLGELFDASKEFDLSFHHYTKGNELRTTNFDPTRFAAWVDRSIEYYANDKFAGLTRSLIVSSVPVFIVGMPRSGTSLTEQILATHRNIFGAGELDDIPRIVRDIAGGPGHDEDYPECLASLDERAVSSIAEKHLSELAERGGGYKRVTDKMPYNFLYLGFIAQLFPNCRVIHCVRNPVDTCLSCYFQDFFRGNVETFDLGHLGAYYVQYRRLMDHWREVLDLPIMDIVYEELVTDLEGQSRKMIDFVGLEWDPQCLRFHESGRVVNTASHDQVRQPIYHRSVGRWRHYEKHLGTLIDALGTAVEHDH